MPKQKLYPLKVFEKAVVLLATRKGFSDVTIENKSGSAVRFELYAQEGDEIPTDFFVVHTEHSKRREIWSKDNYRKAASALNASLDEFNQVLEEVS